MKKSTGVALFTSAASLLLLGTAAAQQDATPAPSSASTPSAKGSPGTLSTDKEKQSYAIGMNIGDSLKKQDVDIDPNLLERGIKDAVAGKTLMTPEEARATLQALQANMRKQAQEKMAKAAQGNKTEGDAFLAGNKSKPGVTTLPDGLQYKILHAGTGPKPQATDTVSCNYRGTFVDGTEFDSSAKHGGQPAEFPVSGVIKGWTEALQMMPVGSKWQLFVPAALAYGERGPPQIGPDKTLIFEVELVSIKPATPKAPASMPTPATPPQGH
jgi:FKBP-type peptidyl-prolyl cis-trans isomerase